MVAMALVLSGACSVYVGDDPNAATPTSCPEPDRIESYESYLKRATCYGEHHVGVPDHTALNEINELLDGESAPAPDDSIRRLVTGSLSICISLLGGGEKAEIAERARTWLARDESSALPLSEARASVDLVESQGWCRLVPNEPEGTTR